MGKGFGCHLPEKAPGQLSGPETMCVFFLMEACWDRSRMPQTSSLLLCHCAFCVHFVFSAELELRENDWSVYTIA